MTRTEQLLTHLDDIRPEAECDDCISKSLQLPQRQVAYNYLTTLQKSEKVERLKRKCFRCGGLKLSTSAIAGKRARPLEKPVKLEQTIPQAKSLGLADLRSIGFSKVGVWMMNGSALSLQIFGSSDMRPALYAFVKQGEVLYVGKTSRALKKRLYHYSRPGPRQRTNIRLNELIVSALGRNEIIEIFAYGNADEQLCGTFKYDVPAALEDDIIRQVQPIWNKRR